MATAGFCHCIHKATSLTKIHHLSVLLSDKGDSGQFLSDVSQEFTQGATMVALHPILGILSKQRS